MEGWLPTHYPMLTDYIFDTNELGWISWTTYVPSYFHYPEMRFDFMYVPTVETIKLQWILNNHIKVMN